MKYETILSLGGEGGSITFYGFKKDQQWYFTLERNELPLEDFYYGEKKHLFGKSLIVKGFEEGMKLLDHYPWPLLRPKKIHPHFANDILKAVKNRIHPKRVDHLEKWETAVMQNPTI